jgi:uncharacterized SAM-binding protein YcdF (DUF218 family)
MFFYAGKVATYVFGPLGLVVILLICALVLYRRPRLCRTILAFSIVVLWAFSAPIVSQSLLRGLENQVPGYTLENAPHEPAIVVLGGFMQVPSVIHKQGDFSDAVDRLLHGFRLYRAGKAPLILVSGGPVPMFGSGTETEAEAARSVLEEWGVPESAILVETRSKNTAENGTFSRDLLAARGIHRVLLVTSAFHMPRAVAAFRKAGLEVSPSPTDYQTGWPEPDLLFRYLPDTRALRYSADALREYVGLFIYRLRGWA